MPDETPISPVGTSKPELTLTMASINNEPIELDATPTSPEVMRMSRRSSKALALEAFQAQRGINSAEREKKAQLLSQRQNDPAVMVELPQTPGPDELEKSGAGKDENASAAAAAAAKSSKK